IEVSTVSSAEKALDLMDEEDFDVIVSDYQMPDIDGLEFLEELKEERECEIPFIMFTGKGREEVAMETLNLGADRYLEKGGDPTSQYEVLADAIKQEFEHKDAEEKIADLTFLLRFLTNVNRLIGQEDDLKTLMEKVAVEMVEIRNYQNIEISLLDRKDGKIKPVASSGVHPEREWELTKDGYGDAPKCVKEVVKNTSTHLVNSPERYCTDCEYIDEREYHDTLLIPISHRSELTGIISVCHRFGRELSEEEIELLEGMGRDLGLARKKIIVENKLKESDEKFKNLAEVTFLPIAIYQDDHWVYANPAAKDIMNYSLEELKEMKHWDFVAPEHREKVKKQVLEKEGLESGSEIKIITKEGEKKWVFLTGGNIDYNGEPATLISVLDIIEKKKKEVELQKTEEELKKNKKRRKLEDFAVDMESIDDEEKLYRLTVEAAKRILDFEICSLDILKNGEFEVEATIGGVREKGTRYPIEGLAKETYRKRESFLIKNLDNIEHTDVDRGLYKSAISVPVGEFGIFMVFTEQKKACDDNDLELAETLIHHAKLVLNRIKGEEKLHKTEERYRRLFETTQEGILILNAETGKIEDANPFLQDILGYSKEELIGKELWELEIFRSIVENKRRFKELVEEGYIRYEDKPLQTKDGEELPVEFVSNTYEVEGKKMIQLKIRKLSERRNAEEAMKESEGKYKKLFHASPDLTYFLDKYGVFKEVNQAGLEILGYEREDIIGEHFSDLPFLPPETKEKITEKVKRRIQGKDVEPYVIEAEKKNGEQIYAEVNSTLVRENGKPIGSIGIVRNTTERKKAEEELKESSSRLKRSQELAKVGSWELDPKTKKLTWSDETYRIFGVQKNKSIDYQGFLDRVHPDDRDLVDYELQETFQYGGRDSLEHRIIVDDEIKWVREIANVKLDEDGNIIEVRGSLQDITEQKEAKEKLEKSEQRYRRLFESAQNGILILDAETGKIEDANPYLQDLLGYSEEKMVGKKFWRIETFMKIAGTRDEFKELLDKDQKYYRDIHLATETGGDIPVEIEINTYQAGDKKVVQFKIIDISGRKHRESLQEAVMRFRKLSEASPNAIILVDNKTGTIKDVNQVAEELLDMERKNILGKDYLDLHPEEEKKEIRAILTQDVEDESRYSKELHIKDSDLNEIPVEMRTSSLVLGDEEIIYFVLNDISKRKEAEEREEFLHSLLRHDLRNKIHISKGNLDLLKESDLPEEKKEYLDDALESYEEGM
ncbi:MAG: PAS domain S-box protein, partial [Thermoplasmata archaeon]